MMLTVNEAKSGVQIVSGTQRLLVVVDAPTREEVASLDARQLATKTAADRGFVQAGLCELPVILPIAAGTDEALTQEQALAGGTQLKCFRAEFTFATMP